MKETSDKTIITSTTQLQLVWNAIMPLTRENYRPTYRPNRQLLAILIFNSYYFCRLVGLRMVKVTTGPYTRPTSTTSGAGTSGGAVHDDR